MLYIVSILSDKVIHRIIKGNPHIIYMIFLKLIIIFTIIFMIPLSFMYISNNKNMKIIIPYTYNYIQLAKNSDIKKAYEVIFPKIK